MGWERGTRGIRIGWGGDAIVGYRSERKGKEMKKEEDARRKEGQLGRRKKEGRRAKLLSSTRWEIEKGRMEMR